MRAIVRAMKPLIPLLVFSDLDGTLLDHESYDWSPARPAIEALKKSGSGIILASSKTAREIVHLRRDMELDQWPCIVENGAGLLPAHCDSIKRSDVYNRLRDLLDLLPSEQRRQFVGFGDMSDDAVAQRTGLNLENAARARARDFSEPGVWHGSESDKTQFINQLEKSGITAQQGGRFLTLSFGANKADRLEELTTLYQPAKTVALGDAPNDIGMLESADVAIVIANPHAQPLATLRGEHEGGVIRTSEPGPVGWNAAILSIINESSIDQLTQETKHSE